nr:MAG: hypothetical protein [Microvirus sp.]
MAKRSRMSSKSSARAFRRGTGVHRKNLTLNPMRGGIRL